METGRIIDRRAGRTLTTKEAEILAKEINKIEMPCKFVFKNTIQHRGVLVFRGGLSDDISGNDPPSSQNIKPIKALDENDSTYYTVNIINEFLEKVFNALDKHPINEKRRQRGLMPANYLLIRGAGIESPKLRFYRNWVAVSYMPLEIGFAKTSGMKVVSFKYPKQKKLDVYENLQKGLKKACKVSIKAIKRNYKKFDYAYIHIKETDLPGHDNKPFEKKAMIEHIDKTLFNFLKKFAPSKKIKVVVTADHSTPCRLKDHSSDPVPVLYYPADDRGPKEKRFTEREARVGTLGRIVGGELFKVVGFS